MTTELVEPEKVQALEQLQEQALAVSTPRTMQDLVERVGLVKKAMKAVMKDKIHYGLIPGCKKPSLWQPGADVLNVLFQLRPELEVVSSAQSEELIYYVCKCTLYHIASNNIIATGLGACNTQEEKYREKTKWVNNQKTKVPVCPWDIQNTILKMAGKRAKIAATINATAATEIFTQDLEEMPERELRQPESYKGELEKALGASSSKDVMLMEIRSRCAKLQDNYGIDPKDVVPELAGKPLNDWRKFSTNELTEFLERLKEAEGLEPGSDG